MLPKNRLGRATIKKLHIYSTENHPHVAQNPVELNFDIKKVEEKWVKFYLGQEEERHQ